MPALLFVNKIDRAGARQARCVAGDLAPADGRGHRDGAVDNCRHARRSLCGWPG